MARIRILEWIILAIILAVTSVCSAHSFDAPLTLSEVERLAITTAPELKQLQANANSLDQKSVADGQWSDPQLIVGAANVPTPSYSFTQDDMTMVQFGLQQSFAPGHSLAMKSKKTKALAEAEQQKMGDEAAVLLRNVRETWLDLYYWKQAAIIINKNQSLLRQLLKSIESQYSAGKVSQSDVLQIQVESTRLKDQSVKIQEQIDILQAQLSRWIGLDVSSRSMPATLPRWPNPPSLRALQADLLQHPQLKVDMKNIEAARAGVAYAKEQYKPGWMLDIGYSLRKGRMQDGQSRSNFVGAQVTVDLPIFPGNRQNRELSASAYQLNATEFDRDIHYKDLLRELATQYAIWNSLNKRANLYRQHLTLESKQNTKSAMLAYQDANTDLNTVLRAYGSTLSIQLEQIQIQVALVKARVALLYLQGIT